MTHAGNVDDATAHTYGPRRTAYQQCLQKAQLPEQRASQVVQTELNDFQGRLQRAIATCQDDVKDGSRAASDTTPCAVDASRDHNTQAATPTRTARRTSSTIASARSSTRTRACSETSRSASRRDYVNNLSVSQRASARML